VLGQDESIVEEVKGRTKKGENHCLKIHNTEGKALEYR